MTELISFPLLHRQDKIVWIFGQPLDVAIRLDPVGVFDAEAHALLGVLQARLDGNDNTWLEDIILDR